MNGPDRATIPDRLRDLIDDYCADQIDEAGLLELEAGLRASESARRYFAEYWQVHAELGFSSRARRATSVALSRFEEGRGLGLGPPRGRRPDRRGPLPAFASVDGAGRLDAGGGGVRGRPMGPGEARKPVDAPPANVAWLVNAQDCPWAPDDADTPGRDMKAGKVLRLERGLAEVEFDRGARVILKGPAASSWSRTTRPGCSRAR